MRSAIVLFCGDAAKDERQKHLPPRFLSRLHDSLLRRLRTLDADVYVATHDDHQFRIGPEVWPVDTLGAQIDRALRFCFATHDRVLIVAGDAPIDTAIVQRALDSENATQVLDTLRALVNTGATCVIVTHDESVAARADRVVHMRDGLLVNRAGA